MTRGGRVEEQTEKLERSTSGIEMLQKWGLETSEAKESEEAMQ